MKNRMKYKLNSVLKAFTVFAAAITLATAVSCKSNLEESQTGAEQGKPVFTFSLEPKTSAARTIMPEDVEASKLTNFTLNYILSDAEDWVNVVTDASYSELSAAKIELTTADIKKEITFELSAKKDSIKYQTRRTIMVNGGQNEVELTLKRYDLGSGTEAKGNLSVNINLKGVKNAETVTKVAIQIRDESHTAFEDLPEVIETISDSSNPGFTYQKNDIPAGNYMLCLTFYAGDVPLLKMNPIIQIADGLTTYATRSETDVTEEFKNIAFNDLYTLSFDPNAGSDTVTYPASTKISHLVTDLADINVASPERTGYLFTGWFMDSEGTQPLKLPVYEDTKVYASWQSLSSDIDGTYFVTMETLADFVKDFAVTDDGYGTQAKPATLKFFGAVTDTDIYSIEDALNTNTSAYFALDFTDVVGLTVYKAGEDEVANLVSIAMPASVTGINADWMVRYPNLKEVTIPEENEYYKNVDGVLYSKDGTSLVYYPPKREETSYVMPEGVERIPGYSIHGSNLQNLTLPASLSYIDWYGFYHSSGLLNINVAEGNKYYKSIDGVVYTADGTTLIAFPIARPSYCIPIGVKVIEAYVFYNRMDILPNLSLENENSILYYSGPENGFATAAILGNATKIESTNDFRVDCYNYIVDMSWAEAASIYDDEVLDVSDSSYSFVDISKAEDNNKFFKLTTVPGTKYRIYWVDDHSILSDVVAYTNAPKSLFDGSVTVLDEDFKKFSDVSGNNIGNPNDDEPVFEFIATGKTAYIAIGKRRVEQTAGTCGFRVRKLEYLGQVEPVINVSIKIDDPLAEFNIIPDKLSDTEWHFGTNGYYLWYVDGEYLCAGSDCYFNPAQYEEGLHTITVERENGSASASIQIEIE